MRCIVEPVAGRYSWQVLQIIGVALVKSLSERTLQRFGLQLAEGTAAAALMGDVCCARQGRRGQFA